MINPYYNDFWEDYIEKVEKSVYWKVSYGAIMADSYGYKYIDELERITKLSVGHRESALKELIWKNRRE